MAKIIRNIPYPDFSNIYTSQQSIKDCIKEIHQMFIDAGLQRSADSGQLDPDNIPDFDLTYFHAEGQSIADYPTHNGTTQRTYIQTPSLVYMFTDVLHTTKPVYISLVFRLARIDRYLSSKTKYAYMLIPIVNIGSSTTGSGLIGTSMLITNTNNLGYSTQTLFNRADNTNTMYENRRFNNYFQNSFVYYNSSKGIFYCNLLPNYRYCTIDLATGTFPLSTNFSVFNKWCPFINFCIIRTTTNCYVDILYGFPNISDTSSYNNAIFPLITHYSYNSNTIYNDYGTNLYEAWKSFSLTSSTTKNGYLTLSQLNVLDYNGTPNTNPYMLVGNSNGLPNMMSEVDVKVGDVTKKYIVRPPMEYYLINTANNPVSSHSISTTISQLIYIDD